MVIFAVELDQFSFKITTDAGEDFPHVIQNSFGEDIAPIFGHKDQMDVHHKHTVSAVPDIVVVSHRPNYTLGMQRLQAYKYELMPDGQQRRQMSRFAGSCRFVYNKALALQKERYEADKQTRFSYTVLANLLPAWKRELAWLKLSPAQILQQSLKDLERAYVNFFAKRAEFPRFKRKSVRDSFRYPQLASCHGLAACGQVVCIHTDRGVY